MSPDPSERARLLNLMLTRAFRVGDFVLSSGRHSRYYFDGRLVTLDPEGSALVGRALLDLARQDAVDRIGGPTLGADPMVTAVALCSAQDGGRRVSAFIVRKDAKGHGAGGFFAGEAPGPEDRVALVDDALTSGASLLEAAERVSTTGAQVVAIYTLLDREEGGRERLERAGHRVRSIFLRSDLLTADGNARPVLEGGAA